jgi:hypothetical protein
MKRDMTADELEAVRTMRMPVHCRTMTRPSRVREGTWVFSDLEELTKENLDKLEAEYRAKGWHEAGPYFVRTSKAEGVSP